jgi:hypothetical protein
MTVPRRVNIHLSHSTERHDSFGYITGTDASHRCHAHASTLDEHSARGRERARAEVRLFFSVRHVGRDGLLHLAHARVDPARVPHAPRPAPRPAPRAPPRAPHTPPPPPTARRAPRPSAPLARSPPRGARPLGRATQPLARPHRAAPAGGGASRAGWRSLAHHAMPRRRAAAVAAVWRRRRGGGAGAAAAPPPTFAEYQRAPRYARSRRAETPFRDDVTRGRALALHVAPRRPCRGGDRAVAVAARTSHRSSETLMPHAPLSSQRARARLARADYVTPRAR